MRCAMQIEQMGFNASTRIAYHCTPPAFVDVIARENVLPFGHARNTKSYESDDGYFGTNREGCYFAGSFDYCLQYSGQGRPPPVGSLVDVLVMSVIPGRERVLQVGTSQMGIKPTPGYTAHTTATSRPDGQRTEWYLYKSEWETNGDPVCEQWAPMYVMTVECVMNEVAGLVDLPSNQASGEMSFIYVCSCLFIIHRIQATIISSPPPPLPSLPRYHQILPDNSHLDV